MALIWWLLHHCACEESTVERKREDIVKVKMKIIFLFTLKLFTVNESQKINNDDKNQNRSKQRKGNLLEIIFSRLIHICI